MKMDQNRGYAIALQHISEKIKEKLNMSTRKSTIGNWVRIF